MKIVMLLTSFYPLMGGAEKQAQRLSKELIKRGHEVTVLTRLPNEEFTLKKEEFIEGIKVIRLKVLKKGKLAPLAYLLKSLFYIYRNRKTIDIVHAHSLTANGFIAALSTLLFKIPSISKIAGGGNEQGCEAKRMYIHGGLKKWRLEFINRHLSSYIAISKSIEKDLIDIKVPREKIVYLPNGIDISRGNGNDKLRESNNLDLPTDKKIYLYAGRFEYIKGIDILLKAWINTSSQLKEKAILVILGEGSINMDDFKNQETVKVIGKVDNVNEYMTAADFFILPSRYEGISNALLEAITHKMPVIISEVGGNTDIIDNESGFLFKKEDDRALTKIIEHIITLNQEEIDEKVKNSFKKVELLYDLHKVSDKYEKLYNNLL